MKGFREFKEYRCVTCKKLSHTYDLHCACGGFKIWTTKMINVPVAKKETKTQKTLNIILAN